MTLEICKHLIHPSTSSGRPHRLESRLRLVLRLRMLREVEASIHPSTYLPIHRLLRRLDFYANPLRADLFQISGVHRTRQQLIG